MENMCMVCKVPVVKLVK